jgi:hypothetical protein
MDALRTPLRIAMLTHSVNPRGGVVHALQLAESLQAMGQDVTLFAPDARGKGCSACGLPFPAGAGTRAVR